MNIYLWITPFITAGIGWGTNWLAVKMLFRPKRSWNFGFFKIQGMVPKRKEALAGAIGVLVHEKLMSHEEIAKACASFDVRDQLQTFLDDRVETFITKLKMEMPMLQLFLKGELAEKVKRKIVESFLDSEEELKSLLATSISEQMNISDLVTSKVSNFSLDELEDLVLHVSRQELKAIEVLGGVLGLLIGLIQVGVIYFTS